MKISAIIFDLDGVIVHTDKFHYLAWKAVADKLNLTFDEEINNRLRGVSRIESLQIILDYNEVVLSETEKDELAEEKNELYKEYLLKMSACDVTSEIRDIIAQIRKAGIKTAIGSSSKNARLILQRIEMLEQFDAISDGNNIKQSKPNPEVFLMAAQYINEKPSECLVVEDAQAGIMAGINGGFVTAAIGDAKKCKMSNFKINSFSDLLPILALEKKGV